jgi:beta-galactosidase
VSELTRRQLLKSSVALSATSMLPVAPLSAEKTASFAAPPAGAPTASSAPILRERLSMDAGWKFALGNACDPVKDFGYGKFSREGTFAKAGSIDQSGIKFDDHVWKTVDLPHDWAEDLPLLDTKPLPEHGGHPLGREYPETSVGWYRRAFNLPATDKARRIQILFDGIYRDATLFLNGHYIATNFSGYAPLLVDITDWVNFGEPNEIAVRADASLADGWFYEGAGIYRHVWLIKSAPVHLVEWETTVRTEIADGMASVQLASEVQNSSDAPVHVRLQWQLTDSGGSAVATATSEEVILAPWGVYTFEGQTSVRGPKLWSVETPTLYSATATVLAGGAPVDRDSTRFGFRTIRFDADKGFFLNGKRVKIKGTCCHQDHAGVGVALPDRVQYYRIERLKSMGSNGLRTSHNPPTPELMDATDALGMLVMCETRMMDSNPEGLSQLVRMIRRFRNHPSIVIWSLGNEEKEQGSDRGQRIVGSMQRLAHRLDPTRLCTVAQNSNQGSGISNVVDVVGFNYTESKVDDVHRKMPKKPIIGTETASTVTTRGIYVDDPKAGYVSSYGLKNPSWASTADKWWNFYDQREFLAGGFAWTGFDYRGEPTPYSWPCVSSQFGIMDTCGFPKDIFFYYKAWWQNEPVLHLFPHWNWPESQQGKEIAVWCHTNLDSVELFVNGKSAGSQKVVRNGHVEWKVKFQPGSIEVRGSKGGKIVLTEKRETVGPPARIVLTADRGSIDANGEDVSMLRVEVQDAQGRLHPVADNEISFSVTGPGKLIGLGNGDPSSHESDKGSMRRVFNGLAQAIVQASKQPGTIALTASASGLESTTLTLNAKAAALRPAI